MFKIYRPTFLDINLSNLKYNLKKIKKKIKKTKLMFVVKGNAYGHGMEEISKFAEKENLCDYFGVSSIEEGLILRNIGINKPILVLGSVYPLENYKVFIENNLIPTISSVIGAKSFEKICSEKKIVSPCHIKIETGMNRIGVLKENFLKILELLYSSKYVKVEGVYSHFSSADTDEKYTLKQFKLFKEIFPYLKDKKIIKHISNSYGVMNYSDFKLDMVRVGYSAYGYLKGFKPLIEWKTKIVYLKIVKKNSFISYNKNYKTSKTTKIATLPIGYADGYLRAFSNKAYVLINGTKCPVIGNVTMDMTMVDVSNIKKVKVGDEVILLGKSKKEKINIDYLAKWANTIGYEIITLISKRVARVYIK